MSPKTYAQFLLPVHKEMVQRIGGPLILHICGNCADRLRMFVEAGFDGYHFEWQVDSKEAVKVVNREMSLVGNINNPTALLRGTPDDVRAAGALQRPGRGGYHRPGVRRPPSDAPSQPPGHRGSGPGRYTQKSIDTNSAFLVEYAPKCTSLFPSTRCRLNDKE